MKYLYILVGHNDLGFPTYWNGHIFSSNKGHARKYISYAKALAERKLIVRATKQQIIVCQTKGG